MTTITIPRALLEQALEAMEYLKNTAICSADTEVADETVTALRAALETPVPYGCHVDLDGGIAPDGCVLDDGRPDKCVYARRLFCEGKDKTACKYWQPIEVTK